MLEKDFDENFAAGLKIISEYRQVAKKFFPTFEERIKFWRETLTPEVWQLLKSGNLAELENKIKKSLPIA